jgi:hypothetical protein
MALRADCCRAPTKQRSIRTTQPCEMRSPPVHAGRRSRREVTKSHILLLFAIDVQYPPVALKLYLVTCDLLQAGDQASLQARIRTLKGQQLLRNQWPLRTTYTAVQLKDLLRQFMDDRDRIVVTEIAPNGQPQSAGESRSYVIALKKYAGYTRCECCGVYDSDPAWCDLCGRPKTGGSPSRRTSAGHKPAGPWVATGAHLPAPSTSAVPVPRIWPRPTRPARPR